MDQQNRNAQWVLLACLVLFLTAVAFKLNGSSAGLWSVILRDPATADSLLLSTPKGVRSDEWLVWTPSMLSQANHSPPFPVENPSLGAGKSTLLMNLPARHFSMIFRPQLYGFFFLGIDRAYAWYWNVKVFGLIAAMFLLLLRLLENDVVLALCGSLWVFLSGFVQWWFSCPPMLPEMLASWALALVCIMALLTAQKTTTSVLATAGLVIGALDFIFCMYPPFQIPLVYLGIVLLAGWLCERRNKKLPLVAGRWTSVCLLCAGIVIAGASVAFLADCKTTLDMVASTSYPGARRIFGGAMGIGDLFSGLADPFMSQENYPGKFSNVCEAAGFYPMWIVAALVAGCAFRKSWRENLLPLGLLAYLLGATAFCVCRLPEWLCRATLWSFTTESRATLGIGIANILLALVVSHRMRRGLPGRRARVVVACVTGAAVIFLSLAAAHASPLFFTGGMIALSAGLAVLLVILFLWAQPRVFTLALLCALAPAGILVNPVMAGLAPLTQAAPLNVIRTLQKADPEARWVVYNSSQLSAFLMSAGLPVISGAKTLPDFTFYRMIDPTGAFAEIYNRYSIVIFLMPEKRTDVDFKLINFCGHYNFIHPTNPALGAMNVRYFVYKQPLENPAGEGLKMVGELPANKIWIYRLE